jgi:hypothetical protein
MSRLAQGVVVGVVLGVLLTWLLVDARRSPRSVSSGDGSSGEVSLAEDVEALRETVERERRVRVQIEGELAALAARLDELAPADEGLGLRDASGLDLDDELIEPEDEAAVDESTSSSAGRTADETPTDDWFSAEKLAGLGLTQNDIERIRERWEEAVMNNLYLADAHARDKSVSKAQLRLARGAANIALLDDLGGEDYDALLYATNQKNRVFITGVLEDSPASEAGITAGDQLISYDGDRIFNPLILKVATSKGHLGEWVAVEVRQGGETRRLFVRRGPLGARLDHRVVHP